jgi:hypothetical protein
MKKVTVLAFALALVLGAAAIIYACGDSAKGSQASTSCGSTCTKAAKTSQVSATDKSADVKVITANSKTPDSKTMSSGCPASCSGEKTSSTSSCPYMKDKASTSQTTATKTEKSAKAKAAKAKVVQVNQAEPNLATVQE